jgi:hypothetical protein
MRNCRVIARLARTAGGLLLVRLSALSSASIAAERVALVVGNRA